VVLNEATNAGVFNRQSSVWDRQELMVAIHIMSNKKGFVCRRNGGQDKAFRSRTSGTRRRWRQCRAQVVKERPARVVGAEEGADIVESGRIKAIDTKNNKAAVGTVQMWKTHWISGVLSEKNYGVSKDNACQTKEWADAENNGEHVRRGRCKIHLSSTTKGVGNGLWSPLKLLFGHKETKCMLG
jgi:hypothetical protein